MKAAAIIPARGGSVRVPRKNIADIAGRPALAWPVETCRLSGLFDRILVSTEDAEIAAAARGAGAEIHLRSAALADSLTKVRDVVADILSGLDVEFACIVYPTAVLITPDELCAAFKEFDREPVPDFVMGVVPTSPHPWKAMTVDEGFGRPAFPDKIDKKGQEQPRCFAPTGTFHWIRRTAFLEGGNYWDQRRRLFVHDRLRAVDIDEPSDLEFARALKMLQLSCHDR